MELDEKVLREIELNDRMTYQNRIQIDALERHIETIKKDIKALNHEIIFNNYKNATMREVNDILDMTFAEWENILK